MLCGGRCTCLRWLGTTSTRPRLQSNHVIFIEGAGTRVVGTAPSSSYQVSGSYSRVGLDPVLHRWARSLHPCGGPEPLERLPQQRAHLELAQDRVLAQRTEHRPHLLLAEAQVA